MSSYFEEVSNKFIVSSIYLILLRVVFTKMGFNGIRVVFQGDDGKQEDIVVIYYPNIDEIIINCVDQIKK